MRFQYNLFFALPGSLIPDNLLRLDTLPSLRTLEISAKGHFLKSAALTWCSGSSQSIEKTVITGPFNFSDSTCLADFLGRLGKRLTSLSVAGLRHFAPREPRAGLPETTILPLKYLEWHDIEPGLLRDISLPHLVAISLWHREALTSRQISNILGSAGNRLKALSIIAKEDRPLRTQIYGSQVIYHLMRFTELARFQSYGPYYFLMADWELLGKRLFPSLQFWGMHQPPASHDRKDLCTSSDARSWAPLMKLPGRGIFVHPSDENRWDTNNCGDFRTCWFFEHAGLGQIMPLSIGSLHSCWQMTERENEIRTDVDTASLRGVSEILDSQGPSQY